MGLYIAGCFTGAVVIFIVMMMAFFLWNDNPEEESSATLNEIITTKVAPIEINFTKCIDNRLIVSETEDFLDNKRFLLKSFGNHIGEFLEQNPECYSVTKNNDCFSDSTIVKLRIRVVPYLEQEVVL